MTAAPNDKDDLEQLVTRIARRAADAVAEQLAEMGAQLALVRESLDAQTKAVAEKERQLADTNAELARANQAADQLRQRVEELEAASPTA